MDCLNPKLYCILVTLSSTHSPKGILMQREDSILEWIFLSQKQNKMFLNWFWKEKLRLYQLSGIDPAEIGVTFTNAEIASLWTENAHWQRSCKNVLERINNRYLKIKRLQSIKRANWTLPHIVKGTFSGTPTFYTDANTSGKAISQEK